jgi:hypothetical protein
MIYLKRKKLIFVPPKKIFGNCTDLYSLVFHTQATFLKKYNAKSREKEL